MLTEGAGGTLGQDAAFPVFVWNPDVGQLWIKKWLGILVFAPNQQLSFWRGILPSHCGSTVRLISY